MIKEIEFPLPTIFEYLQRRNSERKINRKSKSGLTVYDVDIQNDPMFTLKTTTIQLQPERALSTYFLKISTL